MKKTLEQAGGFLPADAEAAEVLKPTEGALDRPAPLVTAKRPTVLGNGPIGSIRCDHLDVPRGQRGVEHVTVVGFVADDTRRRFAGNHEVKQSLHQPALVRSGLGGVGRHWQPLGVNQQHDLHSLSHSGDADAIPTLARFAETGIDEALIELEAAASLDASARLPHDALEDYIRIGARGPLPFGHNPPEVRAVLERELKARARAILGDVPVSCRIEPEAGRTHSRLMQLAREEGADLIVAGSRQLTGLKRLRSSSVSRALLHRSPMNLAIVPLAHNTTGPATPVPVKRHVLVATDLSAAGNAAVPHALALLPDGGLLTLMHVVALPPMIGDHVRRELGRDAALAPAERSALSNRLRALVPAKEADRGVFAQTEVVLAADTGQTIAQTGERLSVDAICLATNMRSEFSRNFLGSVTRTVRELTHRPLLVVPMPRS